ncbi:MAG: bacteriophage abortive infection AbiH family protein [Streptococcaceae bacterium]|jgi:hypothetical protein|nr:bacteriophage abortive infection AbiH family protein [Streptococcaceae bacterium]
MSDKEQNLIIVGNGFDKHHEIPTSFKDFREAVTESKPLIRDLYQTLKYSDLPVEMKQKYLEQWNRENWSDFETIFYVLAKYDIEKNKNNSESNFHRIQDNIEGLKKLFNNYLLKMIHLEFKVDPILIPIFEGSKKVLTFNYTPFVEDYYLPSDLEKIFHIHGKLDISGSNNHLIFGVAKNIEKEIRNFSTYQTVTAEKELQRAMLLIFPALNKELEKETYGSRDVSPLAGIINDGLRIMLENESEYLHPREVNKTVHASLAKDFAQFRPLSVIERKNFHDWKNSSKICEKLEALTEGYKFPEGSVYPMPNIYKNFQYFYPYVTLLEDFELPVHIYILGHSLKCDQDIFENIVSSYKVAKITYFAHQGEDGKMDICDKDIQRIFGDVVIEQKSGKNLA